MRFARSFLSALISVWAFQAFAQSTADPIWQKRRWLEKTARLLRGGDGLTSKDNVDNLMRMSETDVIRFFMKDPRFGDAILDFNTYFLGYKYDTVKRGGIYLEPTIEMSNAVASAKEMLAGGDYFKLFDLKGPVFISPLGPLRKTPAEKKLTDAEVRKSRAELLHKQLITAAEMARSPGASGAKICAKLGPTQQMFRSVLSGGYPLKLLLQGIVLNPQLGLKLQLLCDASPNVSAIALAETLESIATKSAAFFAEMSKFEAESGYSVASIADFRAIDLKAAGLSADWLAFSFDQSSMILNSSTNMNRKRSAYVLKHYFCDDLTPLGFDNPKVHVGGEHGTETSCYACHYKLDPMAGFFRGYGLTATDFSAAKSIYFDDGAQADRVAYENAWKGTSRPWNIGYIRSVSEPERNSYGESLQDLSRILRSAPETKQCLVRRLFEYFVAEKQAVDDGYLKYLTDLLIKESTDNSSTAVKNTIERILLSDAYHQPDMDAQTCYDFAPGGKRDGALPCRVAYVIQQNCVNCHNNSVTRSSRGGLDLSRWTAENFRHLDKNGSQRPARETFTRIVDRLQTTDPDLRMPHKKFMSDQDRRQLFDWAQKTLATLETRHAG